jgi:hypothetical protein
VAGVFVWRQATSRHRLPAASRNVVLRCDSRRSGGHRNLFVVTLYRAGHNPFTTARHKVAPRFGLGSPTTARDFTVIGPSKWGERCYCPAHSTPSSKAISISNASANIRSAASTTQSQSPRQRSSTERQVEPLLAVSTGVCAIFIDDLTLVASVLIMFLPARTLFETS